MILFPRLTQRDSTGLFEVLARLLDADMHFVWKNLEQIVSDIGFRILPMTLAAAPPASAVD